MVLILQCQCATTTIMKLTHKMYCMCLCCACALQLHSTHIADINIYKMCIYKIYINAFLWIYAGFSVIYIFSNSYLLIWYNTFVRISQQENITQYYNHFVILTYIHKNLLALAITFTRFIVYLTCGYIILLCSCILRWT